jgi:transposase
MGCTGAFDSVPVQRADGRGRPIEHDNRAIMDGVLWILRTGAAWSDLPDEFASYTTCFRRFSGWVKDGTLRRLLEALAQDLEARGDIDLSECFIDGTFVVAKKGGAKWERPSGQGYKAHGHCARCRPSTRRVHGFC